MIVDKVKNPTSQNESRVTFDYFRVHEELFDFFLKLFSKLHDNLSDLGYQVFFSIDLKHVKYNETGYAISESGLYVRTI